MPSTSAKQHRFMQAVAHSPSFAKKTGVSQAVGKDFSAADQGRKFGSGGRAGINKPNTRHGKIDMPVSNLSKYATKGGGSVRNGKRFNGDDGESEVTYSASGKGEAYSKPEKEDDLYTVVPDTSRPPSEAKSKPKPKLESKPSDDESFDRSASTAKSTREPDTRAVTGMASRKYRNMPSDEKKAESAERIKDMTMAVASLVPIAGLGRVGAAFVPARPTYRERKNFLQRSEGDYLKQRDKLSRGEPLTPGPNIYGRRGFTGQDASDAVTRYYGSPGKKQGGSIMESKKMMDKEVAFMKKKGAPSSMIKHEEKESKSMKFAMGGGMPSPGGARPDPRMMAAMRAQQAARQQPMRRPPPGGTPPPAQPPMGMKKGGMPMKDGKPAFMQKKMMGGGMAYAKGGGIESRGKTKGTVIRMAAGGSVSSRADGIAQRGKTKFTNY